MKVSKNLPPLTAANEAFYTRINYLEMILRLLLAGIDEGVFDDPDQRREYTGAIRNEI